MAGGRAEFPGLRNALDGQSWLGLARPWSVSTVTQKKLAPEAVIRVYASVLREAILRVRMRIRYGETIDLEELHDLTDALENIPEMLCNYGGWRVEENIDAALKRYDGKWCNPGESLRACSLLRALEEARANALDSSPSVPGGGESG